MGENTGEVRPTSLQLKMVQRISASLVGKRLTEKLSKMSHDSYTNGYSGHLSIWQILLGCLKAISKTSLIDTGYLLSWSTSWVTSSYPCAKQWRLVCTDLVKREEKQIHCKILRHWEARQDNSEKVVKEGVSHKETQEELTEGKVQTVDMWAISILGKNSEMFQTQPSLKELVLKLPRNLVLKNNK